MAWSIDHAVLVGYKLKGDQPFPGTYVRMITLLRKPPDFLSEQDRILLGKVRVNSYGEPVVTDDLLATLVGHPQVYYRHERVDLQLSEQTLRLERSSEGLRLSLHPLFEHRRDYRLDLEAGGVLRLTVEPAWARTLGPILADGHSIPPEGEEQLRESSQAGCPRFA